MRDMLKILSSLPDGIFICEGGVYKVVDGEVSQLVDAVPEVRSNIGTIDDDPKAGGN